MNRVNIFIVIACAILFFAIFFLKTFSEYFGGKSAFAPQPTFENSAQILATSTAGVLNQEEFALQVGGKEIIVSLADTPEKRAKGLMGVDFLEENKGMLFIFYGEPGQAIENSQPVSFWNKNTLIPLDIIWIRAQKIIKIDYLPPYQFSQQNCFDAASSSADTDFKNWCGGLPSTNEGLVVLDSPGEINWVLEANAGWAARNNISVGDEITL